MNIDFVFSSEAQMHSHAQAHKYTHTCALLQPKRMWLCSPLCVLPPAWQMHLLSKSWWIFSLNFKSKPHFPSPSLLREPFMSVMPPASPSNHSLTKRRWKKTLLWILIFAACWACVMNGSNIYSCMFTPHMGWVRNMLSFFTVVIFLTFLWQIVLWLHFVNLSVSPLSILCSLFKVALISLTPSPHSPQSTSASLFHFVLSAASLPEWRLTEVGSILIYFTLLWIFSVNSAVFMHGCQISCVLIRGIVSLICWLTE